MIKPGIVSSVVLITLLAMPNMAFCQFNHGTAIVALPVGNRILLAADSRVSHGKKTTDDGCKLVNVNGHAVFALAGILGMKNISFAEMGTDLLAVQNPRSRANLHKTAEEWSDEVIRFLAANIGNNPKLIAAVSLLAPIQGLFAIVDTNHEVVMVRVNIPIDDKTPLIGNSPHSKWLTPSYGDIPSPELEEYYAFGMRFGTYTLKELETQQTQRSRENSDLQRELMTRGGSLHDKQIQAERIIALAGKWYPDEDGKPQMGGATDDLIFGSTGATWLNLKPNCPKISR